jgi:hypothetical protein
MKASLGLCVDRHRPGAADRYAPGYAVRHRHPPARPGRFDPAGLRTYLARAEALGFDSAWTQEQVLGTMERLATQVMPALA